MVHSVELLLDTDTETAIHRVWQALSDAGLRTPPPASRPHVTLLVADTISEEIDASLSPVLDRLPLPCALGAPVVFGRSPFILVRLVVPSVELLELHAEVARTGEPYLTPEAAPNSGVGQWTPHITLARGVQPHQLAAALTIRSVTRDVRGSFVGLRRWEGSKRIEHVIT
ncbi:MAG: 2'-5' RNA ligase family protein [Mycobacterium sp.]